MARVESESERANALVWVRNPRDLVTEPTCFSVSRPRPTISSRRERVGQGTRRDAPRAGDL